MEEDLALLTNGHHLATFLAQNPADGPKKARTLFGADEELKGELEAVRLLIDTLIDLVEEIGATSKQDLQRGLKELVDSPSQPDNRMRQRAIRQLAQALETTP